jgi:hypothetical protein
VIFEVLRTTTTKKAVFQAFALFSELSGDSEKLTAYITTLMMKTVSASETSISIY